MSKAVDYKQFYKSPWGQAFIAYFVAMGLVGALTPPDILTAYTWTRPFTDFMAGIVPQIDKVTALGIDPDINRFYFSVMWAGSPVMAVWLFCFIWLTREPYLHDKTTAWRMPFPKFLTISLIGFFSALAAYYFFHYATDSKSKILIAMLKTSVGRFFATQAFVLGPTLFFFLVLFGVLGWATGYIPRNIRKQNELEQSHGQ